MERSTGETGERELGHDRAPRGQDAAADALVAVVAENRAVAPRLLFHHSRCRAPVATSRQLAMYLMHVLLGRSLAEVGRFFGRDRTTVSHACARIEDMRDSPAFDDEVNRLEALIEAADTHRNGSASRAAH